MLDKILMALAFALFDYLSKRMEAGKMAVDSTVDLARLHTAGTRINEWVRKQNSSSSGGQSDSDRPGL